MNGEGGVFLGEPGYDGACMGRVPAAAAVSACVLCIL